MNTSVCLFVRVSVLPMDVARPSSGDVAIRYVLPVYG